MSSFEYFSFFTDSIQKIEYAGDTSRAFGRLARLENIPDLVGLYPTLCDGLKQVPKLHYKGISRKFRRWLSSATSGDKDVTEEYLASITEAKGPLDTKTGKFLKALVMASIGAAAGHVAEGAIPGALAGGLIAQAVGPAADFTLDLLDEFLLDGLSKGWQPRLFFDELRKLEKSELN